MTHIGRVPCETSSEMIAASLAAKVAIAVVVVTVVVVDKTLTCRTAVVGISKKSQARKKDDSDYSSARWGMGEYWRQEGKATLEKSKRKKDADAIWTADVGQFSRSYYSYTRY